MEENIVKLLDEDGNEVSFDFLDLITYEHKDYVVLLALDESDEIYIFSVEHTGDEFDNYIPVEDDDISDAVYNMFKERNKDSFEFDD
jgi:uncharacterized protein YrzB (UPF0473 family)